VRQIGTPSGCPLATCLRVRETAAQTRNSAMYYTFCLNCQVFWRRLKLL